MGSYSVEKGHHFLHQPWIIALAESVEIFLMVSISDMPTIKYGRHLRIMMDKAKYNIPKQWIIGDTCFKSLATIEGNLFTRHPKNLNRVHKDSKNLLSVIIILGTNFHVGETVFNYREKMNDIVIIAHVLKHLNGRYVVGSHDKILY